MLKKIISSALALGMVFGAAAYLPEGAAVKSAITAKAETYGDYEYTVLNDGTVEITDYNDSDTQVTIPSKIDGKSVTSIGDWAFDWCKSLTSITIPNSVTSIGEYAFGWCESLTSITIPNSVKSIGVSAFQSCQSLTSITIPNSVTSIGVQAFNGTKWLANKQKKNPLVVVNGILIDGRESKGKVTIPNSVTSIGSWAFWNCESLESITIPNSVTSIGSSAFRGCKNLTSITIPNSVTSIDEGAFEYCTSLKSITIPNSVKKISKYAFQGCTSLSSITIPDSVTSIGSDAFSCCTSLKSITIPDSVTSIGSDAFSCCTSLKSITIPKSVTSIGNGAFFECTSLKSITIPKSVKSIGAKAFGYSWDSSIYDFAKLPGFKIYCYKGTAGEKYAKDNGFDYEYLKSIESAKVTLSKTSYTYTGKAKKPAVTVKFGSKALKKGTDFTVKYKNNKKVGKATVTIKGKGSYTGTITKTFKIIPKKTKIKKLTSPKSKQLKVTYKKVSGVTGYQVTYSTSEKFTKADTKSATVKGASKLSKTVKSLSKGKTYYVKVRAYKTVSGKKYYSGYTAAKKITVK